jgi:hypothetical protein
MAAATSAAGTSLSFVIQVSPSDTKSQDVWLLAKWGSDRPFKGNITSHRFNAT